MHRGRHVQRQASRQRIRLRGRHYGWLLGNEAGRHEAGVHRDRHIQRQAGRQATRLVGITTGCQAKFRQALKQACTGAGRQAKNKLRGRHYGSPSGKDEGRH
jgi:hypothetical protein